jgi:hypothetical protein
VAARLYAHRFETSVEVSAKPAEVFAELDDHERLSAHMMQSSAMMAGSSMHVGFDEAKGRSLGAKIRMSGDVLGFHLDVEEIVTERSPPERKIWQTVGEPRLLVIGDYRMGFKIEPRDSRSQLTIFID